VLAQEIEALNERIRRESAFVDDVIGEMGKVIVGQRAMTERLLVRSSRTATSCSRASPDSRKR